MPTVVPMIGITLALCVIVWGGFLYAFSGRDPWYFRLVALALPMSFVVNELVKKPIGLAIERAGATSAGDFAWSTMIALLMLAPVFEEAIKASPVLVPAVRRRLTDRGAATLVGFAVGVGFGMGEALFVGYKIAQDASMQAYPWYAFTGYMGERLIVCMYHGVMTAMFFVLARKGPAWGVIGYLAAAAMHAYLNAPILLLQQALIPEWAMSVHLLIATVGSALLLAKLLGRKPAELAQEHAPPIVYYRRYVP